MKRLKQWTAALLAAALTLTLTAPAFADATFPLEGGRLWGAETWGGGKKAPFERGCQPKAD